MSGYDDDRDERGVSTEPDVGISDRGALWPGLAALALFGVLAWVFVGAEFGDAAPGFAGDAGVTASIGYAMFNIAAENAIPSEGFLVAFILIAVVLDAALDGAVLLASREEDGEITTALRSQAAEGTSSPQDVVDETSEQEVVADGGERSTASRTSSDRGSDGGSEESAGGEQ